MYLTEHENSRIKTAQINYVDKKLCFTILFNSSRVGCLIHTSINLQCNLDLDSVAFCLNKSRKAKTGANKNQHRFVGKIYVESKFGTTIHQSWESSCEQIESNFSNFFFFFEQNNSLEIQKNLWRFKSQTIAGAKNWNIRPHSRRHSARNPRRHKFWEL